MTVKSMSAGQRPSKRTAAKPKRASGPVPAAQIQVWPIDRLVFYARNPRKNDAVVDRMCNSIREFGFKIPVLARSDGEVVDGHLRLKAARKLGTWPGGDTSAIPVILCDEWTPAQVKAFRLMVNRSVGWADWDNEMLSTEFVDLKALDFDLSLTGFDLDEIADLFAGSSGGAGLVDMEAARKTLAERFVVPPFSVLDARSGYWQDRKRAWLALGIQSELGRGDNLAAMGGAIERREAIRDGGGTLGAIPPNERQIMKRTGRYRPEAARV